MLLRVTTKYKLLKTVAEEESASNLRSSAYHPIYQTNTRVSGSNLIWQDSAEIEWHGGWASGHKRLEGPVAATALGNRARKVVRVPIHLNDRAHLGETL